MPVSKELAPTEIFADMPKSFRQYVNGGFDQLGDLEQSKVSALTAVLAEGHEAMDEVGVNEILDRLGLKVRDKASFGTALGLLTLFITSRDDVGEVLVAAETAGVIPSEKAARIKELALELAKGKATLTEAVESTSLANEVAPSFQGLNVAVELRFRFDDLQIVRSVPVAICHLATDHRDHKCFFQMTKSDVAQLIFQLKIAEAQLNAIEAWSRGRD